MHHICHIPKQIPKDLSHTVHALTEDHSDEDKYTFYNCLHSMTDRILKHYLIPMMGDFISNVGCDNQSAKSNGKSWVGIINQNGKRLIELCLVSNQVLASTVFLLKVLHLKTWNSPCGKTQQKNHINHISISSRIRSSDQDTREYQIEDVSSDHTEIKTEKDQLQTKVAKKINKIENKRVLQEISTRAKEQISGTDKRQRKARH